MTTAHCSDQSTNQRYFNSGAGQVNFCAYCRNGLLWASRTNQSKVIETANWFALSRSLDLTENVMDPCFPTYEMLTAKGVAQQVWHEQASRLTAGRFGRRVFVRAVAEVSNFCRENCCYCGMRRDNRNLDRFRARLEILEELLIHQRPPSVTDVNLQAGEDPVAITKYLASIFISPACKRDGERKRAVLRITSTPSFSNLSTES